MLEAVASPVEIVPPVVVAVPPVPSAATAGGFTITFTFVLAEPPVEPVAVTEKLYAIGVTPVVSHQKVPAAGSIVAPEGALESPYAIVPLASESDALAVNVTGAPTVTLWSVIGERVTVGTV